MECQRASQKPKNRGKVQYSTVCTVQYVQCTVYTMFNMLIIDINQYKWIPLFGEIPMGHFGRSLLILWFWEIPIDYTMSISFLIPWFWEISLSRKQSLGIPTWSILILWFGKIPVSCKQGLGIPIRTEMQSKTYNIRSYQLNIYALLINRLYYVVSCWPKRSLFKIGCRFANDAFGLWATRCTYMYIYIYIYISHTYIHKYISVIIISLDIPSGLSRL